MRATFLDARLEAAYRRDGYVTVPLLDPDEVATLRALYEDLGTPAGDPEREGTFNTWNTFDAAYKSAVDAGVIAVLGPHLAALFDRQRILLSNFLVKYPGDRGEMPIHQDTSMVLEPEHSSAEVWVALEDTGADNGELWMVPGSQDWVPTIRGINAWFHSPFTAVEERIRARHAIGVPMKAGEATVFNHATLHFSRPNRTDRPRLAAITDVIPEEAEHVHCFDNEDGTVEVCQVDEAFWMANTPATLGTRPLSARPLATRPDLPPDLTDADLDALVTAGRAVDTTGGCTSLDPDARPGGRGRRRWRVRRRSPRPAAP